MTQQTHDSESSTRRRNVGNQQNTNQQQPQNRRVLTEDELNELNIKHNAGHVIQIFIPVSICMFVAVILQFVVKNIYPLIF